jgi:electron transfer flavoprotein beta subunit
MDFEDELVKIGVCIKAIPSQAESRLDPQTLRMDRMGSLDINAFDLNAVEEALRLKDEIEDSETVAISLGPEGAWEALRRALALGIDRAVLISDEDVEGSDLLATVAVLGAVLEREAFDLVFFGQQSPDGEGAVLGAAVAERLQVPIASQASEIRLQSNAVEIRRQTEFGYERMNVQLPAVIAVTDSINEPRFASLRGMMAAKKKPIEQLSLSDIGVERSRAGLEGSRTVVHSLSDPPKREVGILVEDEAAGPERIVEFLVEREILS